MGKPTAKDQKGLGFLPHLLRSDGTTRLLRYCKTDSSPRKRRSLPQASRFNRHVFFHPSFYPRPTLQLPPTGNSNPGSHSGRSPPRPITVRGLIFIAGILQHFFPSLTRVNFLQTHADTIAIQYCSAVGEVATPLPRQRCAHIVCTASCQAQK